MKRILLILSVLILVFTSCVTTAPETMVAESEVKKVGKTKEEVVETKIIDAYLISEETLSASDGIVDGFVMYEYDESGILLTKKEMDSEKKQISRQDNQVANNHIVRTQWFRGEDDEPGIYIILDYNGDKLVKETSFDIKDIPQTISNYEYDSKGNIVKWIISSGDNVPMMVTEYEYVGDKRSKATFLTPLGEMEGFIEFNWGGENLTNEKTFDDNGDLEKSIVYEYSDNHLVKEIHYKKTVVSYTVEYELDDNGNALNKKHFYRSGNLKAQWDYSYISVKKEVRL